MEIRGCSAELCGIAIKMHRGTHQIGGSITEIKTDKARIIIDIGAELPRADRTENDDFEIDGVTRGPANCDAVLVTHYHGDHVGMFEKVLPEVPIFMGVTSKKIFGVVQKTIKEKLDKGNPELAEKIRAYEIAKPLVFGDIKVVPYCIDHSAYDAYMFLIEAGGKRILHTGDFRMHGARGSKMPAVFEKYAKDIDVLIIEGTMLSRMKEKAMTEHELGAIAKEFLKENKNVFVLLSSTNIDTIAEFYSAAIATKKPFIVCDDMQAEILKIVTETAKSSFYEFNRQKVYNYHPNNKKLHDCMANCGFCFIGRANYATEQAMKAFPNNLLIYSMWSGYLDKNHPAFDEYKSNWIAKAKKSGSRLLKLHTSGHAMVDDIKRVCEITQAKTIIPIHSEQPDVFRILGIKSNIQILNDGDGFDVAKGTVSETCQKTEVESEQEKLSDKELFEILLRDAESKGDVECEYCVGLAYKEGCGVELDVDKAIHWLTKAAKKDHANAQYSLAYLLYYQRDDYKGAARLFEKSMKNGNETAQEALTACYSMIGMDWAAALKIID